MITKLQNGNRRAQQQLAMAALRQGVPLRVRASGHFPSYLKRLPPPGRAGPSVWIILRQPRGALLRSDAGEWQRLAKAAWIAHFLGEARSGHRSEGAPPKETG